MKDLYEEQVKVVAERNGWSLAHAKGFVDGDRTRRRGAAPSKYAQVGIDEYSLGFRAGYFKRNKPVRQMVMGADGVDLKPMLDKKRDAKG